MPQALLPFGLHGSIDHDADPFHATLACFAAGNLGLAFTLAF